MEELIGGLLMMVMQKRAKQAGQHVLAMTVNGLVNSNSVDVDTVVDQIYKDNEWTDARQEEGRPLVRQGVEKMIQDLTEEGHLFVVEGKVTIEQKVLDFVHKYNEAEKAHMAKENISNN